MLTGRPPFRGVTAVETLSQVVSLEPVTPSRLQPQVSRDLETVCLKCLEKQPARRYASAAALADDLDRFLAGEPVHARPIPGWEKLRRWAERRPARAFIGVLGAAAVLRIGLSVWWSATTLESVKEEARRGRVELLAAYDELSDGYLRTGNASGLEKTAERRLAAAPNDPENLLGLAHWFARAADAAPFRDRADRYAERSAELLGKAFAAGLPRPMAELDNAVWKPLRDRGLLRPFEQKP
jgi:hypothetical protein